MTQNRILTISGLAIGGLFGGLSGAVVGGVIGSILEEIIYCPICGEMMRFINGKWRCPKCGYVKQRREK